MEANRKGTLNKSPSHPVLIDVTGLVVIASIKRFYTGIERVTLAFVKKYQHSAYAVIQWGPYSMVLSLKTSKLIFEVLLLSEKNILDIVKIWANILKSALTFKKKNIANLYLFKIDYIGMHYRHYLQALKSKGVKPVFFLHDLIPIQHGEFFKAKIHQQHLAKFSKMLTLASGILTNSQSTLDALIEYCSKHQITIPHYANLLLAAEVKPISPTVRPINSPYFVMLGTIEPRKNHYFILHIWRRLIEKSGVDAPKLIIIGQRGWDYIPVINFLDRCKQLQGYVIEHPCSDQEARKYLIHAQALLFPSFAEGYGLPLLEALSLGVPAIVSDLNVFREFAGNIPEYVDPLDGKKWFDLIESYTQTASTLREQQKKRITEFKQPTWPEYFEKVEQFTNEMCNSQG